MSRQADHTGPDLVPSRKGFPSWTPPASSSYAPPAIDSPGENHGPDTRPTSIQALAVVRRHDLARRRRIRRRTGPPRGGSVRRFPEERKREGRCTPPHRNGHGRSLHDRVRRSRIRCAVHGPNRGMTVWRRACPRLPPRNPRPPPSEDEPSGSPTARRPERSVRPGAHRDPGSGGPGHLETAPRPGRPRPFCPALRLHGYPLPSKDPRPSTGLP